MRSRGVTEFVGQEADGGDGAGAGWTPRVRHRRAVRDELPDRPAGGVMDAVTNGRCGEPG